MIKVGYIATTYGHKGELKVIPLLDNSREFKRIEYLYLDEQNCFAKIHIEKVRFQKDFLIIKFKEISDMDKALNLRATYLFLPEGELCPLPEHHYYVFQLIGLDVYQNKEYLGQIKEVLATGSNDVFVVQNIRGEILIPALKSVVLKIDFPEKKVFVKLPPGLLD